MRSKILKIAVITIFIALTILGAYISFAPKTIAPVAENISIQKISEVNRALNWSTYSNKNFNFSVQYPPTWNYSEITDNTLNKIVGVSFEGPHATTTNPSAPNSAITFFIQYNKNIAQRGVEVWYKSELEKITTPEAQKLKKDVAVTVVGIDGTPAILTKNTSENFGERYTYYVVVNKVDILSISYYPQIAHNDVYQSMLSTISF